MSAITWLHLSDLHIQASARASWDQNRVLRPLLKDVGNMVSVHGVRPDFIVLSGDVACTGAPEEYALAKAFLDELLETSRVGKECLFIVPGNHDVDRTAITKGAESIVAGIHTRDDLANMLTTPGDRKLVFQRLRHYGQFINEYCEGHLTYSDEKYYYVRELRANGQRVAVLGLNSAWLAGGGEQDRARLALGEMQVHGALEACPDADVRLAILHHPLEWLRDADRDDCERPLLGGCDLVLHGHLHRASALTLITPDAGAMIIAAGACYESRDFPNGYHLVRLDLQSREGDVHLRKYGQGGFWTDDTERYVTAELGRFDFKLPSRRDGRARGTPYRIIEKHLQYQYLEDRRMRQVKRFVIEALQDGVTTFRDRYKWSGKGPCQLSLSSPGATLIDLRETRTPHDVFAGAGPWDVYEVRFDRPLAKGETREIVVEWDLYDRARAALPFYSTTIDVPTDHLSMSVSLHRPVIAARAMVFGDISYDEPTEVLDLATDTPETISWKIENPELKHRYLITWVWKRRAPRRAASQHKRRRSSGAAAEVPAAGSGGGRRFDR